MAVSALSAANGADLLQRLVQPGGQAPGARAQNTAAALKTVKAEAQLSAASVLGGGEPDTTGTLLNTYG